jgi:hypothetical protein
VLSARNAIDLRLSGPPALTSIQIISYLTYFLTDTK